MRLLPTELGLWVSLLVSFHAAIALPHVSIRDASTPCTGNLAPLNTNGLSPGSIYQQLQSTCNTVANTDASLCRCNLIAYNLNTASDICQQNPPASWPAWAQASQCTNANSSTGPPDQVPYNTGPITIPKWAHEELSDELSFNLDAALQDAKGWSAVQIATPIIVGVGVLILAGIAFYFYRRRKRLGSVVCTKQRRKAWQNANLRGPRRFFGLLPDTSKVRPRNVRDPLWEIDQNNMLGADSPSPPFVTPSDQQSRYTQMDASSVHSRTTSITSLLSSHDSSDSGRSRGIFSTLASKFSALSLKRNYQSGTAKGPDYKRVHVLPCQPGRQFKIDGGLLSPDQETRGERWNPPVPAPTPFAAPLPLRRDSTLPSVLDIRGAPSMTGHTSRGRSDMYVPDDDNLEFASPVVAQSDYSLGTTDLQTPVTPSRDAAAAAFSSRQESKISPGSPFLPSTRYTNLNALMSPSNASLPASRRNRSTDSLAFELYPRPPS